MFATVLKDLSGKSGSVEIDFKDSGLASIEKEMGELQKLVVTYGFQGRNGLRKYESGINVATVALMQEFGTEDIPARSFMRRGIKEGQSKITAAYAKAIGQVAEGKATAMEALSDVGMVGVMVIRKAIDEASSWATPLDSATVKAKGSSKPLVDKGLLRSSVSYAIRRGNNGPIVKEGTI